MKSTPQHTDMQSALINDRDFLKEMLQQCLENLLQEEFLKQMGSGQTQRSGQRQGQRNSYTQR